MKDNIMFYPAIFLFIAEIVALALLIRGWIKATKERDKNKNKDKDN